mmetsp:Transcript_29010/g.89794  ORF Transcript_29010/g.89794 Transcript_29010/m.89794 type:complete len:287 (+) Transcript_29010:427-1287(+)
MTTTVLTGAAKPASCHTLELRESARRHCGEDPEVEKQGVSNRQVDAWGRELCQAIAPGGFKRGRAVGRCRRKQAWRTSQHGDAHLLTRRPERLDIQWVMMNAPHLDAIDGREVRKQARCNDGDGLRSAADRHRCPTLADTSTGSIQGDARIVFRQENSSLHADAVPSVDVDRLQPSRDARSDVQMLQSLKVSRVVTWCGRVDWQHRTEERCHGLAVVGERAPASSEEEHADSSAHRLVFAVCEARSFVKLATQRERFGVSGPRHDQRKTDSTGSKAAVVSVGLPLH